MLFQVFTPDGSIVDGEIVDHKNGTYEFVYIVPKEGDFSLALRLYDQHIKGSPFKLTVSRVLEAEVEVCVSDESLELCLNFQNKGKCLLSTWSTLGHLWAEFPCQVNIKVFNKFCN